MLKNILVIRLDNMGDVLMSTPAIRALKEHFNAHITLLTSAAGASIAGHIPLIDRVIAWEAPWMKGSSGADISAMADQLKTYGFDAAVIFTVCTQNPLPPAMLAFMAEIPVRAAYCRENPYALITHWLPDAEPYDSLRHQVLRDLALAAALGAVTQNDALSLEANLPSAELQSLLAGFGVNPQREYVVLNCAVSEPKRKFPAAKWAEAAQQLARQFGVQVLCTGMQEDAADAERIAAACGGEGFSLAGKLSMEQLLATIRDAQLVLTVNSGPAHMAAALGTPVIVAYAKTNPQHTPWCVQSAVLYFDVQLMMHSRNMAVRFVGRKYFTKNLPEATPANIVAEASRLLAQRAGDKADSIV